MIFRAAVGVYYSHQINAKWCQIIAEIPVYTKRARTKTESLRKIQAVPHDRPRGRESSWIWVVDPVRVGPGPAGRGALPLKIRESGETLCDFREELIRDF